MIANRKEIREQYILPTDVVLLSKGTPRMVEPEHLSDELVPKIFSILMTFPHPIISRTTAVTLNVRNMDSTIAVSHVERGHMKRQSTLVIENKMFQLRHLRKPSKTHIAVYENSEDASGRTTGKTFCVETEI
jgi:hypothetical protein